MAFSQAAKDFYAGFEDTKSGIRFRHVAGFAIQLSALPEAERGFSKDKVRALVDFFSLEGMVPPNGEIISAPSPPSEELIVRLKASPDFLSALVGLAVAPNPNQEIMPDNTQPVTEEATEELVA